MSNQEIVEQARTLQPMDRLWIIEQLLQSLDEPDATIAEIWAEEAEKRLEAYRNGTLEAIPMENIFHD
uniref:Addiction module component, TIGR02574 family n=1 Tax=Chlorobium chlorochromatii (strain CaD3) TaxID=340177 RepID=Q3ARI4_CHLCH